MSATWRYAIEARSQVVALHGWQFALPRRPALHELPGKEPTLPELRRRLSASVEGQRTRRLA